MTHSKLTSSMTLLGILYLFSSLTLAQETNEPTIDRQYTLVSKQRINRTEYDFSYKVNITNISTPIKNVSATVSSTSANTKIIDNNINFNDLAADETTTSLDTFTLRQDRRHAFDSNSLSWVITFDSGTTQQEEIKLLESSGAIPDLERESTIKGIDSNSNGVRDDIEAYIDVNYNTTLQRATAMQAAKAMQKALLVDVTDIIAAKKVNIEISRATHCIYDQFDGSNNSIQPAQVSQEIESITTNTKARLLAYLAFNKALNGTSWTMPEGDSCE